MDSSAELTFWQAGKRLACTSASCCIADAICTEKPRRVPGGGFCGGLPADLIKVRIQLQNELAPRNAPRLGVLAMSSRIASKEGACPSNVATNASYGGLCFWAYPFLRDALTPSTAAAPPLWAQLSAGAISGGCAAALANPCDVVKVRLQGDGRRVLDGKQRLWPTGAFATLQLALRTEGLGSLYTAGLAPNVCRAAVVNGCGIACYDSSKGLAQKTLAPFDLGDWRSLTERFVAALAGGAATSLAGTPFDVVKTRLMSQSTTHPIYRGPVDCILATVKAEGPLALWKGLLPVYCRQAPFNMLNYLIMESLMDAVVRE
ncbi:mitochondrial carrier domain-containing protein [Pelagophyceae sp. CCMP2097]|nr:mitochondrial carrier domain-containing protein [Pelagophyceae sp. CCMP2097]